ncbi:MAG: hypothetical protein AAFR36_33040, partial [Bacteroidota bacterium]
YPSEFSVVFRQASVMLSSAGPYQNNCRQPGIEPGAYLLCTDAIRLCSFSFPALSDCYRMARWSSFQAPAKVS